MELLEQEREIVMQQLQEMKMKEKRDHEEKRKSAREMQEALGKVNMEQAKMKQRILDAEHDEELRIAACILFAIASPNLFLLI